MTRKEECNGKGKAGAEMDGRVPDAYGVGTVIDNRDPEKRGRIKVSIRGGASAWLPVLRKQAGEGHGPWSLPEIGTQVAYILTNVERCEGVALGYVRGESCRPPETSAKKASESKVLQTRKHRIEIIEEEGKEEIRLESAEGKMRAVIGKEGGISLVNELGDIKIKCRSLECEGEGDFRAEAKKGVKQESGGELKGNTDGKAIIESGKEVKVAGKNVRLKGSRGVCAEGKQMAVEGDKVMGFDVHQMEVPSANGTQIVPLPHPFIGELKEKLTKDVKIGNRKCAVKGSVAKHRDAMHMQLPGTIKFQQNPKKEGEVTGGTSAKVKIDGKETAVMGSTVTTCNDVGARDNSTIIAVGASMPMPAIINPVNTEEWKREREEGNKKEPAFQNVKWEKTSIEEWEEAELTASVKDIADGNAVTLQVYAEGRGPEDGAAYASIPVTVRNGAASAKWTHRADRREMPPEENPRFIFTAHSAWCKFERSSNTLEVKLMRPEITKAEWRDADGNATSKCLVGEAVRMHAEVKDLEEGQGVTFTVRNAESGETAAVFGAEVKDGIAEAEWTYHYNGERLTEKPKYTFEVSGNRCRKAKSGEIEIGAKIDILFLDSYMLHFSNVKVFFTNGSTEFEKESKDGAFLADDLTPGDWKAFIRDFENDTENIKRYNQLQKDDIIIKSEVGMAKKTGITCRQPKRIIVLVDMSRGISN